MWYPAKEIQLPTPLHPADVEPMEPILPLQPPPCRCELINSSKNGISITTTAITTTRTGSSSQATSPTPLRKPSPSKRDSKLSISSSTKSHKEYIDSLEMPSSEQVAQIAQVQEEKERKRSSLTNTGKGIVENELHSVEGPATEATDEERERAAGVIQRNYRGHRERRMLNGMSLDPSTRWIEAVKEARYRIYTEPRARSESIMNNAESDGTNGDSRPGTAGGREQARHNWKKIGLITRRAGGDEDSDSEFDEEGGEEELERRRKRLEAKMERRKMAKLMDLQYFLEMVDVKHRYGSNLRTYHEEWKVADTKENFFYWLDYGEGRYVECVGCPRERLERERVRYLSKEERKAYLVRIDSEGRLCWAKNGARIDTTEKFRDSVHGIVPDSDVETPVFRHADGEAATGRQDDHDHVSTSTDDEEDSQDETHHHESAEAARADKYATPAFDKSRGIKKVKHVSASTIFDKLLRGSVKKNTWIFVADTSFRLYVGIKQSGSFQHSSFLHGSRISAAGLIKVKNGRLSKLSPLSGHYRPPVSNFRAFIHNLKAAGVDMSHVSISRSYAVLVGLEAYVKTRRRGKTLVKKMVHGRDKILSPEEVREKEEKEMDKSESAKRERKFLEEQQKLEEEDRADIKLLSKLGIRTRDPTSQMQMKENHRSGEE